MKTILWHLDAIQNGDARIVDCFKVQINIWFKKEIFNV